MQLIGSSYSIHIVWVKNDTRTLISSSTLFDMSMILDKLQALDWEQIVELLQERNVQYGLLAGLVGVYVLRRMLRKPKYNMPPGPRGLPLVGNILSKPVENLCSWLVLLTKITAFHACAWTACVINIIIVWIISWLLQVCARCRNWTSSLGCGGSNMVIFSQYIWVS